MLQNLTSLFEIFVGFNLAYVLADSFSEALNQKIVVGYNKILKRCNKIKSKIEVVEENLKQKKDEYIEKDVDSALEICKGLEDKRNGYEGNFLIIRGGINDKVKTSSNTANFTYICLFASLYSLFVLLLSGLGQEFEDNGYAYQELFLAFNIISFLFVFLLNINFLQTIGYQKTLLSFAWFTIGYIGLFIIEGKFCPYHSEKKLLGYINVAFTLIIPTLHFFIALKRASTNSKKNSPAMDTILDSFELEFNKFVDEIEVHFKVHDKLKADYEIKKRNPPTKD